MKFEIKEEVQGMHIIDIAEAIFTGLSMAGAGSFKNIKIEFDVVKDDEEHFVFEGFKEVTKVMPNHVLTDFGSINHTAITALRTRMKKVSLHDVATVNALQESSGP